MNDGSIDARSIHPHHEPVQDDGQGEELKSGAVPIVQEIVVTYENGLPDISDDLCGGRPLRLGEALRSELLVEEEIGGQRDESNKDDIGIKSNLEGDGGPVPAGEGLGVRGGAFEDFGEEHGHWDVEHVGVEQQEIALERVAMFYDTTSFHLEVILRHYYAIQNQRENQKNRINSADKPHYGESLVQTERFMKFSPQLERLYPPPDFRIRIFFMEQEHHDLEIFAEEEQVEEPSGHAQVLDGHERRSCYEIG